MRYVIAEKENGKKLELSPMFDFYVLEFDPENDIELYQESIEGSNKTSFLGNRVSGNVFMSVNIRNDIKTGLRKLKRFFITGENVYLRDSKDLSFRYPAQVVVVNTPEKINRNSIVVNIEFLCETPTKESVKIYEFDFPQKYRMLDGTWNLDGTYDLSAGIRIPFPFDADSDVTLDPRDYFVEVEFKGNSKGLIIENETTGDKFEHKGITSDNDKLILTTESVLLNNKSVIRNTNKRLISFAPDENLIKVRNFTGAFKLIIRFRKQQY